MGNIEDCIKEYHYQCAKSDDPVKLDGFKILHGHDVSPYNKKSEVEMSRKYTIGHESFVNSEWTFSHGKEIPLDIQAEIWEWQHILAREDNGEEVVREMGISDELIQMARCVRQAKALLEVGNCSIGGFIPVVNMTDETLDW